MSSIPARYNRPGRDTLVQRDAVMRKNWLAAAWAHWFRARPLVPDAAFQTMNEPYPGHWRRFPGPWPGAPGGAPDADARTAQDHAAVEAAFAGLPARWRHVVLARYLARCDDQQVAADLGLTVKQVRDILARARAAVRDELDRVQTDAPR
jgi:RNA polymerase sigma factor (sigma-70 family)